VIISCGIIVFKKIEIYQNVSSLFVLYSYENLRKVRTNTIGINPFKWLKYVLFRKLGKVTKYAGGFSIPVRVTSDKVAANSFV
jgi:hypothetical protein